MDEKAIPHYDLDEVKRRVSAGRYSLTGRVTRHLRANRWDLGFPGRCVEQLDPTSFHKSQEHRERPGQWLDIYRPWVSGARMYVKFTVESEGNVLILSLCRDGEVH